MATKIAENWVECYGGESCVVTLGTGIDNCLENLENSEIFIIIPGNPGLGSMYQDFMSSLHCSLAKPELSIWAFSYIGHDSEAPTFLPTGQTYILEDQILHKLALLEKLIPRSAKITLIGHSIGCKVIMEVFKRNTSHQIQDIFFLFPTIENMISTSRGAQIWPLVSTWRPVAVFIVILLNIFPSAFLTFLTRLKYGTASNSFISAAVKFLNPNFLNNVLVMAKDELETVLDLDIQVIRNMVGKLHLYHGEDDGWSPLSYRDNLLREVPELGADARIDTNGIPHAFVEFDGVKVGEIVGDWIKEIDNK
eukprot:TRINITY_DN9865_c0_g1_i2.p1 TRINITY_DN9865_c0_g1~~TRINITY_DN9865_c0_g1_i2.p1  ORF type:complete len:308 (-),score=58.99 TRINITY_DN9865_c0_g1_i2:101-1024(-)